MKIAHFFCSKVFQFILEFLQQQMYLKIGALFLLNIFPSYPCILTKTKVPENCSLFLLKFFQVNLAFLQKQKLLIVFVQYFSKLSVHSSKNKGTWKLLIVFAPNFSSYPCILTTTNVPEKWRIIFAQYFSSYPCILTKTKVPENCSLFLPKCFQVILGFLQKQRYLKIVHCFCS